VFLEFSRRQIVLSPMATASQTYEQKCEARCRATPIHCAPSQVAEDRVIFREVAIKMPLSVACSSCLPPIRSNWHIVHTAARPIPVLGEVSETGCAGHSGWTEAPRVKLIAPLSIAKAWPRAQEPICIATVSAAAKQCWRFPCRR
jgi:hypothetical protein